VVGGWIRDQLLDRPAGDLDLTIEGDAETASKPARRLAAALGIRAHLLGAAPHRVWRIESRELKIELWPMGALTYHEDMARRDFSCNALSLKLPDGPLEDPVGGLPDLRARRLRAISRANLEDDPVRLLRGPRFLAQLENFTFDPQTRLWIGALAPRVAKAPRERVGQELTAMLGARSASRGLRECLDLGLFEPAAPAGCRVDEGWVRVHLEALRILARSPNAGETPAPQRTDNETYRDSSAARLAFLFLSWGIPTGGRLAPYSWPKTDREIALRAARLLDAALATVDAPAADRRELAWRAGAAFPALVSLGSAIEPGKPSWRRWRRQWRHNPSAFTNPTPILTGSEIAEITGMEPGPELGAVAKRLLRAQVRGEIRTGSGARAWLQRTR
jgi:tRNA nucleotidyltransferase (CCA-adding enzyme)